MSKFDPEHWQILPRPTGIHRKVEVARRADPEALALSETEVREAAAQGPQCLHANNQRALVRFWHRAESKRAVAVAASGWWWPADPKACDLERAAGDWWTGCFEVPADWQASYRLLEHEGAGAPGWWHRGLRDSGARAVADPLAPERHTAARGTENSVVRMPGALRPWMTPSSAAIPQVLVAREGEPKLWWWASASDEPLPLLVLTDGDAHVQLGTHSVFARAIELGALPPLALVLVDAGDRPNRLGVPWGDAEWIATTLVPRLRTEGLPGASVTTDRERTIIGGSSFGGLTALFAVAQAPETIGAAIAQSTSFWRFAPGSLVAPLAEAARAHALRIAMQSGIVEGPPPPDADEIAVRLRALRSQVVLERRAGGHDWAWWVPALVDAAIDLLK